MKLTKITSINNELIKLFKNVYHNQLFAKKNKLFVIEKAKLINEAIAKNIKIKTILITESTFDKYQNFYHDFIQSNKVILISDSIAKFLSINVDECDVFALCEANISNSFQVYPNENYIFIDNVQDPGNLGTIIRTAFGLGINKIFLYNCVYLFNNKCTKSCCGANFNKNIYVINDVDIFFQKLKSFEVISTSLDIDSEELETQKFKKSGNVIIVGNEGHGIGKNILKYSTKKIKLKMLNDIESFNVAVFAGIICFKILKG